MAPSAVPGYASLWQEGNPMTGTPPLDGTVVPFRIPALHPRGGSAADRALAAGRASAAALLAARDAAGTCGPPPPGIVALFREVDAYRSALAARHPGFADALMPCVLVELAGGEGRLGFLEPRRPRPRGGP